MPISHAESAKCLKALLRDLSKQAQQKSVIVTHGGVIMTLLAVYGMPQAKPFEWVMDNGFGYSVRITPQLWQRDKIMEVFSVIPEKKDIED